MSESQMHHRARHIKSRQSWGVRVLDSYGFAALAFVLAVFAFLGGVLVYSNTPPSQGSPASAATTTPSVRPVPPLPAPTPTQVTPAAIPAWVDWQFTGATLTIPASRVPINQLPITELQPGEVVQKTYLNSQGNEATYEAVEPATKEAIVWDTQVVDGVRYPVGSVLSASAENTNYVFCHDYSDDSAPCSTVFDDLKPGDIAVIETSTEILTYTVQESFALRKGDVTSDARLKAAVPGRLVLVTCNSGGQRNDAGETMENSVIVFQLSSAVTK